MKRFAIVGTSAVLLFGAGAAALVVWLTREAPRVEGGIPFPAGPAAPAAELPQEPAARERALETNEARRRFEALRRGFDAARRTRASEARLLPALDVLFPERSPRWTLECRGQLCRLEVEAPASEWRQRFAAHKEVRRHTDRVIFDPDGEQLAFVELVALRVADGAERPEGDRILDGLEKRLLASEAARSCLAEGPASAGAEVRLMIDRSGVTYRFGTGTDRAVAYCLMMQAMPDVVGGVSAPEGVQRAERKVLLPASP